MSIKQMRAIIRLEERIALALAIVTAIVTVGVIVFTTYCD